MASPPTCLTRSCDLVQGLRHGANWCPISRTLRQVNIGRRNRAYEAPEIIAAFTDLEQQLASPEGDTRTSKPVRRVPWRR